ncbi:hypothetical protein FDP41_011274 [Naegleria fowleri]|uniref:Uncharacterized protein n=1 Tax=Naegleria fowleri TaxID=5763 RepID=A0A6A5C769_NAEFO|nr:uncharacterized protein FDP41_011274 [Naegleria fowleri]KAF0982344.1 hypothetical protein FDP41_011274 [Naegleria fowleri]CAG4718246.1 unnamed protein product [Naegleria fowleri]
MKRFALSTLSGLSFRSFVGLHHCRQEIISPVIVSSLHNTHSNNNTNISSLSLHQNGTNKFSINLCAKDSFTSTLDPYFDRLKAENKSETVPNYRTPTHTIHYVINTLNEMGRATSADLFKEINTKHPGLLASKRHLKKLLTILKKGNNVAAVQPLRGQLTNKKVSFEYKLTKHMKRQLQKPAMAPAETSVTTEASSSSNDSLEDELFNKTMEAVQKGNQ